MTALAQVDAVLAGRCDPGAAAAAAAAAIRAGNPRLNAVVDYDPAVIAPQVAALAERLARGERPPLAGLPVTVKDHIHVAGWPATEGYAPFAGRIAFADDPAVARLRRAGAIVIGRTNMSQFGCKGVTTNPIYGVTRHPADPALTPGGSSGGAAAAVAAGFCALALASDGGGSIRRPAAHVGVVGLKPSAGVVANPQAFSHTSVLGLLAPQVAIVARAFAALRGADPRDPASVDVPAPADPPALRWAWAPTLGLGVPVDPMVRAAGEAAVARLAGAGLAIEARDPAWPDEAGEEALMPLQHAALAATWGAAWRRDPMPFDPDIGAQIESGLALDGVAVARADGLSRRIASAAAAFFADGVDVLVALTTPCVAWPHDRPGPSVIGGQAVGPRGHAALTPLVNHALLPAITVPCGTAEGGLPCGIQIIGPRFADDRVIAAAALVEAVLAGVA